MPIKDIVSIDRNGDNEIVKKTNGYLRRYVAIYDNEDKFYYLGANLHRDDGPAIEKYNGEKEWWLFGERLPCNSDKDFESYMKNKAFW